MAYVPVSGGKQADLLETAEHRWQAVLASRPNLAPAVVMQRSLLTLVLELDATLARPPLPRLSLPPKYLAAKLGRGIPVFCDEPIPLPVAAMTGTLTRLCEALAAGGAGEAAAHIGRIISSGELDAGSLLAASLKRDQTAI